MDCGRNHLVIHHANNNTTRQLTRKQFLVGCIEVAVGYGKRLAHNTTNGILCQTLFECLGVSEKDGWTDFHLANKQTCSHNLDLELSRRHEAEIVPAAYETYLGIDFIQQVPLLEKYIAMQTSNHTNHFALICKFRPLC